MKAFFLHIPVQQQSMGGQNQTYKNCKIPRTDILLPHSPVSGVGCGSGAGNTHISASSHSNNPFRILFKASRERVFDFMTTV